MYIKIARASKLKAILFNATRAFQKSPEEIEYPGDNSDSAAVA
jgi:hypothetical protein